VRPSIEAAVDLNRDGPVGNSYKPFHGRRKGFTPHSRWRERAAVAHRARNFDAPVVSAYDRNAAKDAQAFFNFLGGAQ
jgi:hypothetical protein